MDPMNPVDPMTVKKSFNGLIELVNLGLRRGLFADIGEASRALNDLMIVETYLRLQMPEAPAVEARPPETRPAGEPTA